MEIEPSLQGEYLRTPVTSKALTLLRNQIGQDTHMPDGLGKLRLQKLASAAEKAFAERALLVGRHANCDRRPVSFEGMDQGCLGRLT